MTIKELILDENSDFNLEAISLVNSPAVEVNFIALSKTKEKLYKNFTFTENKVGEKMMIYGPAMTPNKLILRLNEETDEYYQIYFSKDTVEKCCRFYMTKNFNKFSIEHETETYDAKVVENWIINDSLNDKANNLGFVLPQGTWMCGVKIENESLWEKIKNGELRGFSIEGFFADAFFKQSKLKEKKEEDYLKEQLEIIYSESTDDEQAREKLKTLYNTLKK